MILVEGGGEVGVAEVFEEMGDLGGRDAGEGKRGDIVFGEELGVGGFVAVFRSAAGEIGEEEKLVGVKGVRRMAVEVTVEDSSEFGDADFVAGFLADFAGGGDGRRLANIGPTTGKSPAAIFEFADEEDASIPECGDADVYFGSGVTGLLGEKIGDRNGVGEGCASSHNFGGNVADFVVTVNIELILAVSEAGLRDGLEASRPGKPLKNGHRSILAVREAANKSRG
jgi:hypothetical protein